MALASATGASSFDVTANTNQLDLSSELAEVIRMDNTSFLSRLGSIGSVKQRTHYWVEDALRTNSATLNEALDDNETGVDVATGHGSRFKVGTLFKFKEKGSTEVCQVTAISTDTLTVVRGYGSTSGQTHSNGATIHIIAHTRQENQDIDEDDTQERSSKSNMTQIFQRGLRIAYTREKIENNGIASEFAHQIAYRLKEEMRALDSSVINGVVSAAPSDSVYGSMGGLIEFVSASGGNNTTTDEALSESVVNQMCEDIIDDAGAIENGFLLVSPSQRRTVSTFDEAFRRGSFDQTRAGYYVEKFVTDMGFELEVIQDPWVPDDTVVVGDLSAVKVLALQGDEMRYEELAKLGRSLRGQVTGQYTCEVRNALEKFAVHSNLS